MKSFSNLVLFLLAISFAINCQKGDQNSEINNPPIDSEAIIFPNPKGKTVLMCHGKPWQLADTTQWKTVYANLDVFKFYIDHINTSEFSLKEKRDFVQVLKKKNIKIAVEVGGLLIGHQDKGEMAAEYSFESEMQKIQLLVKPISEGGLGGSLDMLDIDGALRRIMFDPNNPGNGFTLNEAVEEVMDVIELWKGEFPEVTVNYLVNFPNWGWKGGYSYNNLSHALGDIGHGDFNVALPKLLTAAATREIEIEALTVDNPYDYAMGAVNSNQPLKIANIDWMQRIVELEEVVTNEGWEFNLIYNSEKAGSPDARDENEGFYNDTMDYLNAYESKGGDPNGFWVQSWYFFPNQWLSEDSDYTMTNLTKAVMEKVKQ